jgi:hypothetical protein
MSREVHRIAGDAWHLNHVSLRPLLFEEPLRHQISDLVLIFVDRDDLVAERAQALATMTGRRAIHFKDWEQEFCDLDILVSSTAAPHAIITWIS